MKKEKINISAQRKKDLLERVPTAKGFSTYAISPSKITQKDINYMVNVINKRLYNLEKKGLTDESNEYQVIEKYAMNGNKAYNVNMQKGTIRVKSSTKGMTARERESYVNTLRNILRAKTSTAKGVREAQKARYKGFLESEGLTQKQMSYATYDKLWKAFNKANKDRKEKYGYSLAITLSEDETFKDLTSEEMDSAYEYMADYENPLEGYAEWLREHKKSN